jgi:hypothetical protein
MERQKSPAGVDEVKERLFLIWRDGRVVRVDDERVVLRQVCRIQFVRIRRVGEMKSLSLDRARKHRLKSRRVMVLAVVPQKSTSIVRPFFAVDGDVLCAVSAAAAVIATPRTTASVGTNLRCIMNFLLEAWNRDLLPPSSAD